MTKMPLCDGGVGEDGEFAVDVLDMDLGHPQSAYGICVGTTHFVPYWRCHESLSYFWSVSITPLHHG